MKVALIQMDMEFGRPEVNFPRAEEQIRAAAGTGADVIALPETWNVGFFPRANLQELSDREGRRIKEQFSPLARELGVNLVAGSLSNRRGDRVYNTTYVFDRQGACVAEYDKTHLFTPMEEQSFFAPGDRMTRFSLDGVTCGLAICYDIRFPELIRTMAVGGLDVLFVAAQWPAARMEHWRILTQARAIENQCFVVATNSCGRAGETQFGGGSVVCDPWGEVLCRGGGGEEILTAELDLQVLPHIREHINVYRDRRPELYRVGLQEGSA